MKPSFLLAGALAAGAFAADLPVREVILYKSGVGYFERAGALRPGESARLDFKASDMNDVLKSLTIQERGGGKISGLRYDSMDPLSHKLSEFPFQIGDKEPLSGTLDQLKGARVELKFGGETVAGEVEKEAGVPILSKIPFLKRLFTNRSNAKDELVLLILVKPTILIQHEQEQKQFPLLDSKLNS